MALGSFNSFTAGTTIVASQMNANFATITSWSSELARLDGAAFTGACTWTNTITVGSDGTGYDVKFFGDSAGHYMLWDQSADELVLTSDSKLSFHDAAGGENIVASADGHLEVNAGTTLDLTAPTIDLNASTEVIIDGDVDLNGALDVSGTTNLDAVDIDGNVQVDGTFTVGVDDTGYDVLLYGNTASMKAHWDTSQNALAITSTNAALRLVDTHSDSAPYIGFYDSSYNGDGTTGRLGYVGYPNSDDLYVRNHDTDGDVYIMSANKIEVSGALGTEYNSSIPRVAYRNSGGAASVASYQLNNNPTIFINPAANPPSATAAGDIWFGI
tara:strand:+ start:682 stop:1665 length:984 start_codon:yes stop_codon:yes gene_type:complete